MTSLEALAADLITLPGWHWMEGMGRLGGGVVFLAWDEECADHDCEHDDCGGAERWFYRDSEGAKGLNLTAGSFRGHSWAAHLPDLSSPLTVLGLVVLNTEAWCDPHLYVAPETRFGRLHPDGGWGVYSPARGEMVAGGPSRLEALVAALKAAQVAPQRISP